jgi:hypothetical protein
MERPLREYYIELKWSFYVFMMDQVCDIFISFFGDSLVSNSIWNIINYIDRWPTFSLLQMSLLDDIY